jgi:D-beta-D-heptose 7-phosphate kinase/D-beta-D-heptose 1-phosphate adenosyltransferase
MTPLGRVAAALSGRRILVVGDAMLDTYLSGPSRRLCQEAPVPVVAVSAARQAAGGAANVAANARAMGAEVILASVIGHDWHGDLLLAAVGAAGVPTAGLIRQPGRQTLTKSRVIAGSHMVVRFDQGSTEPAGGGATAALCALIERVLPDCDAVIVSDYGYGTVTAAAVAALTRAQSASPTVLAVDAKDFAAYRGSGVSLVKPNFSLAAALLGETPGGGDRAGWLLPRGEELRRRCGAGIAAVTLDTDGAVVFEAGRPPYRTYARPHGQLHAAGAGDTYLAAFTLALAAGIDAATVAELAAAAAAVVLGKEGTATCAAWEIEEALAPAGKLLAGEQVRSRMDYYHSQGRRIILTGGCFDLLHRGHTTYLNRAKALGDVLVVGLNGDESVRRLKGPGRPVNLVEDRAAVLAALSCVDHVVVFDGDDPRALIRTVRPHAFVKGGDYTPDQLVEAATVEEHGGTVQILPYEDDRSTSGVIERILRAARVPQGQGAGR